MRQIATSPLLARDPSPAAQEENKSLLLSRGADSVFCDDSARGSLLRSGVEGDTLSLSPSGLVEGSPNTFPAASDDVLGKVSSLASDVQEEEKVVPAAVVQQDPV